MGLRADGRDDSAPGALAQLGRDASQAKCFAVPYEWLGLGLGFLLGAVDILVLNALELEVHDGVLPMTVAGVFSITYAALGFAIGKLITLREKARHDSDVIGQQLKVVEQQQAALVDAERLASIGRMAAGVAHEVRNPLAVINSAAALITESVAADDADARKAGAFISAEIARLDRFVRTLLDFSRPLSPSYEHIRAEELQQRLVELTRVARDNASVGLSVRVSGGPWIIDADLVSRSICALVVNACEAAASKVDVVAAGAVELKTGHGRDGQRSGPGLVVTVSDDGPGIAPEVRDTLFEAFVTAKPKGTGLGLSMARRIAEVHGGSVDLTDDTAGARFVIRFASAEDSVAPPDGRGPAEGERDG